LVTRPLWSLVRAISGRCDATLVASTWQVQKLTEHDIPKLFFHPFGIERDIFRDGARSLDVRRELLALAGRDDGASTFDVRILVGVGRFAIEKRWDVVIDAFLRVRARGHDAILVLFGDGPERTRMVERTRGHHHAKDIVFPGFTKDRGELAASLASADMLVHACPFETFGLSIAEAMSCGLPVVVPDSGGAAEMHDASSGEQYASGDSAACASAIERLLERLRRHGEDLRLAATRRAARLPSVREQFERQIALYTELLSRRRTPPHANV
jgi:alpha-1,6-mannosyltransferase